MDLKEDAILESNAEKTYTELRRCAQIMQEHQVAKVRIVATQTLRRASNSKEVTQNIERILNAPVEIIDHQEEAALFFKAVMSDMPENLPNHLVVDMGGGSVQLIIGRPKEIHSINMMPTGAAYLHDKYIKEPQSEKSKTHPEELKLLKTFIHEQIRNTGIDRSAFQGIPIVYGSSNIADLFDHIGIPLSTDGPSQTHPMTTHPQHLQTFVDSILPYTYEEREAMFNFQKGYMWGIDKAFANIIALADEFNSSVIIPSNANISQGIIFSLAQIET
ncbi:hypothetical protein KC571_04000 [candidate division WWE3 bacterium]|uniref:Ppx/GppA phosphatase N-terminal domain-containing protein n=1 Tax=candidate division WWE3 bacterium TaxID=2053526 RepID=A0A955LH84_UNCKA|nr:hypothetical protein [candidate division WWE3 bacterium]